MSARVLFIGLDAAEPTLLRSGMAGGHLPALTSLEQRGASASLANCMLTLPGAVWPEIASGVDCGRLPRFFHPRQIITGDAAPRALRTEDVIDDPTFWDVADAQGRRVAVIDIPHTPRSRTFSGMQVVEYGLHDHHFGRASHPDGLFAQLESAHGRYPVDSCDHRGGSRAADRRLLADLLDGVRRKTQVVLDVLGRERWDLFACAFSEAHCGGHWFWRYLDERHHDHDGGAPQDLRDAVMAIYRALDDSVGRIVAAAGAETIMVLASHGMAPYVAGYQLLPEVLARLGLGSAPPGGRSWVRDAQNTLKHWIPRRHWEGVGRLVVEHPLARAVLRPMQRARGAMFFPLESPETRAVYVPNNTIGAVRLNLRGREPFGRVEPGADADAVMRDLSDALLELRQPSSGQPIVAGVERSVDVFGPGRHPDVPDLIIRFRQDLGLLDTCESPRVGRVHVPVGSRWARRSGDHSPRTTVWMTAPGLHTGGLRSDGALTDIAPTLLDAAGCQVDPRMQGHPLHRR